MSESDSLSSATFASTGTPSPPKSSNPPRGSVSGLWVRVGLACLILVGSGVIRAVQAHRIERTLDAGRRQTIDLNQVPLALGSWLGEPTVIDEQIARGTGADAIVTRHYVNQDTGVGLDVILLFGPAVDMYIHVPETCYPTAGFTLISGPAATLIEAGGIHLPFRSLVYGKGEGPQANLQEVYYSWRYNGQWTPEIGKQKHFERIPSMYKVHVARRVNERERRDVANPCESFLRALLPELERRIAVSKPSSS